jgi:RNA polymerase sigma factor (TIGR02999 family)
VFERRSCGIQAARFGASTRKADIAVVRSHPVPPSIPITELLQRSRDGDRGSVDALFSLVYDELSRIAHRQLARFRPGETLNTSALVHDAYLRLVDQTEASWNDRVHFFATAARAMRFIVVDYARQRSTEKRGGGASLLRLDEVDVPIEEQAGLLVDLDEILTRLATVDERLARIVELRFFGGLTEVETAEALGLSDRTVRREWLKAKAWLHCELSK